MNTAKPGFIIRIYLTDDAVESFAVAELHAPKMWEGIEPARLFAPSRIVLAGENSKSVYVSSQVVRIDFEQETYDCWPFPGGYGDVVELSEGEFKKHVHLDQPEQMAKREQSIPVGDLLVSFIKLHMVGGRTFFVMVELPVKLPAESQSFMQFLLSKGGFHMRMREGGIAVINLALLAGYTVYPGVAQVPSDSWMGEPLLNEEMRQSEV